MSAIKKDAEETAELVEKAGASCLVVKANVAREDDVQAMFAELENRFGGLDFLVSNALPGS